MSQETSEKVVQVSKDELGIVEEASGNQGVVEKLFDGNLGKVIGFGVVTDELDDAIDKEMVGIEFESDRDAIKKRR